MRVPSIIRPHTRSAPWLIPTLAAFGLPDRDTLFTPSLAPAAARVILLRARASGTPGVDEAAAGYQVQLLQVKYEVGAARTLELDRLSGSRAGNFDAHIGPACRRSCTYRYSRPKK